MALIISPQISDKLLKKHGVSHREVEQCFENRYGRALIDNSEKHKTNPPTMWFVAPTNRQRVLKIVYIQEHGNIYLKTAYEPSTAVVELYERHC